MFFSKSREHFNSKKILIEFVFKHIYLSACIGWQRKEGEGTGEQGSWISIRSSMVIVGVGSRFYKYEANNKVQK